MLSTTKTTQAMLLHTEEDLTETQNEAIDYCYGGNALLMVPVGFGKTVVSQTAAQARIDAGLTGRVLVIAPLRVAENTWQTEYEQWQHLNPVYIATGKVEWRRAMIENENHKIVVINFDIVPWFFDTYGSTHTFDGLIVDELTKFKAGGHQFKKLRHYLKDFTWRVGMTGTLAEEGLEGIFYQAMVVDKGEAFGRRKDKFLWKYFHPIDYQQRNWEASPGSSEAIAAALAPFTFQAEYEQHSGLPDLVVTPIALPMPDDARAVYDQMCKEMFLEVDAFEAEATNTAVLTGKLQQICNGFLYGDDGATLPLHAAKIDWLRREIGDKQTLIAYSFKEDLVRLRARFPEGKELRDAGSVIADWNSGKLPVLFIHPKSGGHGLNLQHSNCDNIMFYGPIWSRDQTDQLIGRLRRRGNTAEVVNVTVLVMGSTVEDCVMLPRVAGKGEVARLFRAHLSERAGIAD